jgi:hypothetical protein
MNSRWTVPLLAALVMTLLPLEPAGAGETGGAVTISGTWRVALDRRDEGRAALTRAFPSDRGEVWLPGSIQSQGFGDEPTWESPWIADKREAEWARPEYDAYRDTEHFKMPFWLQPERVYVGAAVFERAVHIPPAWAGLHVRVSLERVHWVSEAWLDGDPLGKQESLSTAHVYDLGVVGEDIEAGGHTLTLRVDNRLAYGVGPNAHSVSDHTQGNWNGVVGAMELVAQPLVAVERVRVSPDAESKRAGVEVLLVNRTDRARGATLRAEATRDDAPAASAEVRGTVPANGEAWVAMDLDLGADAALWSEFSPSVYSLRVDAISDTGTDRHNTSFGLRDIGSADGRFTVNGDPVFLRGTLDCLIYPLTGYAPMDVPSWERVYRRVKEFGLNHVRYHSWCPPAAAFEAADRVGVYLQVEGPFWTNQGPELGLGQPIDRYVYEETDRILAAYGNHASFALMAYGNEPNGPERGGKYLRGWVNHYKEADPRRLYTSGSGWPIIEESQFHVTYEPRIQRWGEGLKSTINSTPPSTERDYSDFVARYDAPIIAHEIGQWCVFPDFAEMGKYTGHLKPKNFEIFRDLLQESGQGHLARDFLMSSGRLQVMCYKEEIEAALRTPGYGGFQLLDLHDFPGQGTALVGVLDPFWDPKGYITAEAFRSFCGPVTPLTRLPKRVYTSGETLEADLELAQFGAGDLRDARALWSVETPDGRTLASGAFDGLDLPAGELCEIGVARAELRADEATRVILRVGVEGTDASNAWDLWVYPREAAAPVPAGVSLVHELTDEVIERLHDGGTVVLLPPADRVEGGVAFGFSPVFWNTAWTADQPPHTLGVYLDPAHPLFSGFPTDGHTDWQWWDLIGYPGAEAGAMVIDHLPAEVDPIVRPIDTWFRSRRLASLFEARVGSGKLVVCSFDLTTDLDRRPAAKRMRASLMDYIASDAFEPDAQVGAEAIRGLFRDPSQMERLGASAWGEISAEGGYPASNAIDGDPATMWHSSWSDADATHPHAFTIELTEETPLLGIRYLPRQSGGENGMIGRYEVQVSSDGKAWRRVASGAFERGTAEQGVLFGETVRARFVRLRSLDAVNGSRYAAIAELRLVLP